MRQQAIWVDHTKQKPMIYAPSSPQGLVHMPQALPSLIKAGTHGQNNVGVAGGITMRDDTTVAH